MHRISNPRDVEEADDPPSAPSTVARSTREQDPLRASSNAWFVGVLVAGYGLLLVGTTSAEWLSLGGPGSHLGPPSIIQAFTLRIAEGVYLGIFGVVLAVGGSVLSRKERSGKDEGRLSHAIVSRNACICSRKTWRDSASRSQESFARIGRSNRSSLSGHSAD